MTKNKPENDELPDLEDGALATDPELEAALREAAEAVEAAEAAAATSGPDFSGLADLVEEMEPLAAVDGQPVGEKSAEEQVEDLSAELIDLKDGMLRLQADFDNFRKRALKERQEALQYGHQNLVKDLLSAVDNLERGIDHARKSEGGDLQSLLQGVELVQRELLNALANHGVNQVEAMGKPFDPAVHEAMVQAPDGSVPVNTVIDVFQQGYLLRDRLLRPARVVVAKQPDEEEPKGEGEASGG